MAKLQNNMNAVKSDRDRIRKINDRLMEESSKQIWGADHPRMLALTTELFTRLQAKVVEMYGGSVAALDAAPPTVKEGASRKGRNGSVKNGSNGARKIA